MIKKWERESKLVRKFELPIDSNREMIRRKLSLPDDVNLDRVYQLSEIVDLIEQDRIERPNRTPIGNCLITLQKWYVNLQIFHYEKWHNSHLIYLATRHIWA